MITTMQDKFTPNEYVIVRCPGCGSFRPVFETVTNVTKCCELCDFFLINGKDHHGRLDRMPMSR